MIFVDCKLTVYYRIFQLDTVNSSPRAIWCGFEHSCENLWVPFTDPGHFTYGIAGGTGWKCIYISFSSFTTPNQQLIISCRYRLPIDTKEMESFFSARLCASKYHKQQIKTMFAYFLFIQNNNNDDKYIIHHEIQDAMISL